MITNFVLIMINNRTLVLYKKIKKMEMTIKTFFRNVSINLTLRIT